MDNNLLDIIMETREHDRNIAKSNPKDEAPERELEFKRDENGILWSYDVKTGEKVGRIYEHGADEK